VNGQSLDRLFLVFARWLFLLLALYGVGMIVVIAIGNDTLATKLINVWSTMFGATVGLGSGYLLGRSRHPGEDDK
jgi:Trk-type K+ transport system membrane component